MPSLLCDEMIKSSFSYLQSDVSPRLTDSESECDPLIIQSSVSLFTPVARIIDNSIKGL